MDNIVIHLFETYRHFYLYDVNSNMVVEIGKILYDKRFVVRTQKI